MPGDASPVVIVLGHARSGTSLAAGMIKLLGVDMGYYPESIPKITMANNPHGSFEDPEFIEITTTVARKGRDALPLAEWLKAWVERRASEADGRPWGAKSALAHHCLADILHAFRPIRCVPHIVVCRRELRDLTASWQAHRHRYGYEELSEDDALGHVQASCQAIEREVLTCQRYEHQPRWFGLWYQAVRFRPIMTAMMLADWLGLVCDEDRWDDIDQFALPIEVRTWTRDGNGQVVSIEEIQDRFKRMKTGPQS